MPGRAHRLAGESGDAKPAVLPHRHRRRRLPLEPGTAQPALDRTPRSTERGAGAGPRPALAAGGAAGALSCRSSGGLARRIAESDRGLLLERASPRPPRRRRDVRRRPRRHARHRSDPAKRAGWQLGRRACHTPGDGELRLGVFTVPYSNLPLEQALDRLAGIGVQAVELGTGNYPGSAHCDPDVLLDDEPKRRALRSAVESRGMVISALSQHGNPLHPDPVIAGASHDTWKQTVRLASLLEVPVVNAFSGCPGSDESARWPNWVTCWWPTEYSQILEWQWSR